MAQMPEQEVTLKNESYHGGKNKFKECTTEGMNSCDNGTVELIL